MVYEILEGVAQEEDLLFIWREASLEPSLTKLSVCSFSFLYST